jgi:hypothetical protein
MNARIHIQILTIKTHQATNERSYHYERKGINLGYSGHECRSVPDPDP